MQDIGAVADLVSKHMLDGLLYILTLVIGNTSNGPIVLVAGHLGLLMVVCLMEFKVEPIFYVTTALWVRQNNLIVCVFMIGDARLIPCPRWCRPMSIALVLVYDRRHLVFAHSQYQLLHFQAAMVINGVVISDLAILIVQFAMEIEGLSDTDAGIDDESVVRRINI